LSRRPGGGRGEFGNRKKKGFRHELCIGSRSRGGGCWEDFYGRRRKGKKRARSRSSNPARKNGEGVQGERTEAPVHPPGGDGKKKKAHAKEEEQALVAAGVLCRSSAGKLAGEKNQAERGRGKVEKWPASSIGALSICRGWKGDTSSFEDEHHNKGEVRIEDANPSLGEALNPSRKNTSKREESRKVKESEK